MAKKLDKKHLEQTEKDTKEESKAARKQKALVKLSHEQKKASEEGHLYKASAW